MSFIANIVPREQCVEQNYAKPVIICGVGNTTSVLVFLLCTFSFKRHEDVWGIGLGV